MAILLFSLLGLQSASAQDFVVRSIVPDSSQAVLSETDSGQTWTVVEGDIVDGWTVFKIEPGRVTIIMPIDEDTFVLKEISANPNENLRRLTPVKRKKAAP